MLWSHAALIRQSLLESLSKGRSIGSCKEPKVKLRCLFDCMQHYTNWPNGMVTKDVWGKVFNKLKGDKLTRDALRGQCKSGCLQDAWEILLNHLYVVGTKAGRDRDPLLQAYAKTLAPDPKKAGKIAECLTALTQEKSSYQPSNVRTPS